MDGDLFFLAKLSQKYGVGKLMLSRHKLLGAALVGDSDQ